ncbi:MAG: type II toxin-antitoxin system VapC family toxin [Deltaproteobacteria bacterium]|nr:type II toxin-antitoxin system VapC family toxin [Deltaproteobacteria bacterium]
MNLYFFDSSALVKRYVHEAGSQWVHTVTRLSVSNILFVSRITLVEISSAFARLEREGKVDSSQILATFQLFEHDWKNQYQIVEIDEALSENAGQLVRKYPLRAYDSVQLASALSLLPFFNGIDSSLFTFVCADDRLLSVAQSEGLRTENPNSHLTART